MFECVICGKDGAEELNGFMYCNDCYKSMTTKDMSFIRANVENFKQKIDFDSIEQIVCDEFGITPSKMNARTRDRNVCFPRQIAHYLSSKYVLGTNDKDIGERFGNLKRCSVIHSKNTISNLINTNKKAKEKLVSIESKLNL